MMEAREVSFASDGATLAGSLWFPEIEPLASVVMVGGSGPSDRHNDVFFPPIREHLLANDIAVLSYDKRGVGGSSGSWAEASIDDLAQDARAAYDALRAAGPAPVGLYGHSEGGWTVLRAAAGCRNLAFVITNSTPGVGAAVQDRYAVELGMRAAGEPQEVIAAALQHYDALTEEARRGVSFAGVQQRLHEAREFMDYFGGEPTEDDWRSIAAKIDHDPDGDLAAVACPHLALFGTDDPLVPVSESVDVISRSASIRPPGATLTMAVFPGAKHRLQMPDGALAPGYLSTLTQWIIATIGHHR